MKNNNKVLSLLGLATKAGKIASGEFSTEKSVKSGKGFLVLVAADASENTKKKFRNMCEFYEGPTVRVKTEYAMLTAAALLKEAPMLSSSYPSR